MNLLKALLLILVISLPVGVSFVYTCCGEKEGIDLVENLNEEEEGDDTKGKDYEESEFLRNYYVTKIQYFLQELASAKQYAAQNDLHAAIVLDVQTPPPENTML